MFKIITLPFDRKTGGFDDEALTRFAMTNKIIYHQTAFFQDGDQLYWSVFLVYDPLVEPEGSNIREMLDDRQKVLYDRLKAWRKERADKDGVPVFIIATNRELFHIAKQPPANPEALKNIKGFGKSKVSKYGNEIIQLIRDYHEKQ